MKASNIFLINVGLWYLKYISLDNSTFKLGVMIVEVVYLYTTQSKITVFTTEKFYLFYGNMKFFH